MFYEFFRFKVLFLIVLSISVLPDAQADGGRRAVLEPPPPPFSLTQCLADARANYDICNLDAIIAYADCDDWFQGIEVLNCQSYYLALKDYCGEVLNYDLEICSLKDAFNPFPIPFLFMPDKPKFDWTPPYLNSSEALSDTPSAFGSGANATGGGAGSDGP